MLSRALHATEAQAGSGVTDADLLLAASRKELAQEPGFRLDYVALVDPHTLLPVPALSRTPSLLAIAGWVGTTRLIDNLLLTAS